MNQFTLSGFAKKCALKYYMHNYFSTTKLSIFCHDNETTNKFREINMIGSLELLKYFICFRVVISILQFLTEKNILSKVHMLMLILTYVVGTLHLHI